MKYKYTIEILTCDDGRIIFRAIEADNIQIKDGTIMFVSEGEDCWIPIAVYPSDKTIITKIENLE